MIIKVPSSTIDLASGSLKDLALQSLLMGAKSDGTASGTTTYSGISSSSADVYEKLTTQTLWYIVAQGGEVYNYNAFFAIDPEATVPTGIRGNKTTDIEGNEIGIKRKDWKLSNHEFHEIDGKTYISSGAHRAGGQTGDTNDTLYGSEIKVLMDNGYTVLPVTNFVTLRDSFLDLPVV